MLSSGPEAGTTPGFILRLSLQGHCTVGPFHIEHPDFLDMPSNSSATTLSILTNYLKISEPGIEEESPEFLMAAAEMPLYVKILEEIYPIVPSG